MVLRLHLRVAIGALNAFWVLAVGAFALLVTYTVSMQQLEDNGDRHVAAIAVTAALTVDHYFSSVDAVAKAGQRRALLDTFGTPSDFPPSARPTAFGTVHGGVGVARVIDTWAMLMASVNFSLFDLNVWFLDGTRMLCRPMDDPRYLYIEANYQLADGNLTRQTFGFDRQTVAVVPPGANAEADRFIREKSNRSISDSRDPMVKAAILSLIAPLELESPPRWSPVRFFYHLGPVHLIVAGAPLHNSTGHWIGYVGGLITPDTIAGMLDGLRSTPGAVVATVDMRGYIVGATTGVAVSKIHPYSGGSVPEGCATTDQTQAIIASTRRLMSCQYHIRDTNIPGLRYLGHHGVPAAGTQTKISTGSTRYFVRIEGLVQSTVPLRVVVLLPEEDILGDVERTVVIAGIATAVVVLIAAAVSFGFVWSVLRPLVVIADSMGKAARLQDDETVISESRLVEISDLQRAFVEMRDELSRIRAFVPQSLLRAPTTTDEDYDDEFDGATPLSRGEASSRDGQGHSRLSVPRSGDGSRRSLSKSGLVSPHADRVLKSPLPDAPHAAGLGHRFGTDVTAASVSVLCGNLVGFHAATKAGPRTSPTVATAAVVEAVLHAAAAEKGVVDSFHGDRFRVSFNAVRPAANHSIRATVTALRLCSVLEGIGYALPVTCGVATGTAQIGNTGCDAMKAFTILGPVVSQAAVLERMCKLYDGVRCLVPQHLFQDLGTAVSLRTVDYVKLPFARAPCLVGSALQVFGADTQDEWMYQLAADATVPADVAARNTVWAALARNDTATAAMVWERLPTRGPDRLGLAVLQGLEPRPLGVFYDVAATGMPAPFKAGAPPTHLSANEEETAEAHEVALDLHQPSLPLLPPAS